MAPPARHLALLLVLLLTALLLAPACAASAATPPGTGLIRSVIDGDTVELEVDGRVERVRLLGIDTPETSHPTRPVECFGAEATARARSLLPPGTLVRLERDVEPRDQYGRLLLYLFRADDGVFVNEVLVEEGYADVLVIEPNGAYAPQLRAARARANQEGRGLWSACGGADVPLEPR